MFYEIVVDLFGFVIELDFCNVEYIIVLYCDYQIFIDCFMVKRCVLWCYFFDKGGFMLVFGSVILFDFVENFQILNEVNLYYCYICDIYGICVVIVSMYINIGIDELEELFCVYCMLCMEVLFFFVLMVVLFFCDGKVMGVYLMCWQMFLEMLQYVLFFVMYQQFIDWMLMQIEFGVMYNSWYFWILIWFNGDEIFCDFNCFEFCICDCISVLKILWGVIVFYEVCVQQVLCSFQVELFDSCFLEDEFFEIVCDNEVVVVVDSFDVVIIDWCSGDKVLMKEWIEIFIDEFKDFINEFGMDQEFDFICECFEIGNFLQCWLVQVEVGVMLVEVIQCVIEEFIEIDWIYDLDCLLF